MNALRTISLLVVLPGALASMSAALLHAHPGDGLEADNQAPYSGSAWREVEGGSPTVAFPASGVALRSWIPLADFDPNATRGNDCWGYTSPSGREYALVGLNTGSGVAEITDPGNTQVVTHLPGVTSIWRDIKTYSHFAYAASQGGGGIQIFDLSGIDSGVIVDKGSVTSGGGSLATHNLAINAQSARLYRVGGSSPTKGLRIYSLADPNLPVFLGSWDGRYCHDAQVVTWSEAPFAGVEIAFCYANDTSTSGTPGIEILDVSDPQSISVIGSIDLTQPPIFSHPASYSHQGWLSWDRRYLYFNDELDEAASGNPTLTRIISISDLANPTQVGVFSNSTAARDHNLYTLGTRIFQANYRSGLRVLDASFPLSLSEFGFFDTYPPDDDAHFNGLWSVYPYFASGTVIGSDIEKGLFVWSLEAPPVPAVPPWGLGTLSLLLGLSIMLVVPWLSRRSRR